MTAVEEVVQIPFFQGIPAEALREIAVQSTILCLEAGRTFISQHAAAEHVFFLISGSVQFYIHFHGVDDLLVGTMRQPGALLGWSVVRKPHRYTATVRCEEECRVLRLPRETRWPLGPRALADDLRERSNGPGRPWRYTHPRP